MGFKDFDSFNLTLLSKQLWRIHNIPSSLVATTLKEKYFKNLNIFKASSKILMGAKHVLNARVRWRVGDGVSIRIRQDKWLPNFYSTTNCGSQRINCGRREAYLNESLISTIFWDAEVNTILNIPLGAHRRLDQVIWGITNNG